MRDESFPRLEYNQFFPFPSPESWDDDVVAVGGNLSPGMLISAYAQGIFPWFNEGEDILWWSLDPRFILYPEALKVSRSMRRHIRSTAYRLTLDRDFPAVMEGCGKIPRKGQDGTWISTEMIDAYSELHSLGFAHSVEVWEQDELVGGLYGLSLGNAFFGESMFARRSNASKTALIALCSYLSDRGFAFIDCQQHTDHLGSLGAADVPRSRFLEELKGALKIPTTRGNWGICFPDFPSSLLWNELCGTVVSL